MYGQYFNRNATRQDVGPRSVPTLPVSEVRERSVAGTVSGIRSADTNSGDLIVSCRVAATCGSGGVWPTDARGSQRVADNLGRRGFAEDLAP